MSRNGFTRSSDNSPLVWSTLMEESAVSADLKTSPRLTAFLATRSGTEYQSLENVFRFLGAGELEEKRLEKDHGRDELQNPTRDGFGFARFHGWGWLKWPTRRRFSSSWYQLSRSGWLRPCSSP